MTTEDPTPGATVGPAPDSVLPEPAAASGVGSLPGTTPRDAANLVFSETDLPYVPELPNRGPGAEIIGRTMALLSQVDPAFSVTTTTSGWRITDRPGRDVRRALSWWGEDLDAVEEFASGYVGPVKLQLAGPLTLAANVELVSGEKVLRDAGARRDIASALEVAAVGVVADLRRRVPNAHVVVQFDEPSLPAVLAGVVKSASGLTTLSAVEPQEIELLLEGLVAALHGNNAAAAVHSCAPRPPLDLWRTCGFDLVSFDATLLGESDYDHLGAAIDAGQRLLLGAVRADGSATADSAIELITHLQRQLSFDDATWLPSIGVSPTCGLASLKPDQARGAIAVTRAVARSLRGNSDSDQRDISGPR